MHLSPKLCSNYMNLSLSFSTFLKATPNSSFERVSTNLFDELYDANDSVVGLTQVTYWNPQKNAFLLKVLCENVYEFYVSHDVLSF